MWVMISIYIMSGLLIYSMIGTNGFWLFNLIDILLPPRIIPFHCYYYYYSSLLFYKCILISSFFLQTSYIYVYLYLYPYIQCHLYRVILHLLFRLGPFHLSTVWNSLLGCYHSARCNRLYYRCPNLFPIVYGRSSMVVAFIP